MCGNCWKLYYRVSKLWSTVSILIIWSAVLSGSWAILRDSIWGGAYAGWSSWCECGKYRRPASFQSVGIIEKDLEMSVVEEFWLQERIFRFFRLRHNVGTSELRRVAILAGYLCKDGRLTESGRIFANNLNPKELQRAQSGRNIPPASWAAE